MQSLVRRHVSFTRCLLAVVLSFALCACITPPKLGPQQPIVTSGSLGLSSQTSAPPPAQAWWTTFNDPQLDRLMEQALADNPTLAQAMARVREAQSLTDVTHAGLAPFVAFNAQESRQRFMPMTSFPRRMPVPSDGTRAASIGRRGCSDRVAAAALLAAEPYPSSCAAGVKCPGDLKPWNEPICLSLANPRAGEVK